MTWKAEASGELDRWLQDAEAERLEFKEARNRFDFEELLGYCVALSNEGGGRLIFGVSRSEPRQITGTNAFPDLESLRRTVFERISMRVETIEIVRPEGRVLIVIAPRHPVGRPAQVRGAFLMRSGDALVGMTPERLREIFDEADTDSSAELVRDASLADVSEHLVERFRDLWIVKSGNVALGELPRERFLEDAELFVDGVPTVAALVLLGSESGLGRFVPSAEAIFEYRSADGSTSPQDRLDLRVGFLSTVEKLWERIRLRNDRQHFHEGLFVREIETFRESVVREALLNAFCHRDYRRQGSIMIRQYPRRLEITSPGGFPAGITVENVLRRNVPRNRRLAEALHRCGLVDRGGQGMDRMFRDSLLEGKRSPSFDGTDDYQVVVTLDGEVSDVRFLRFLEELSRETLETFSAEDLLAIDQTYREIPTAEPWRSRLPRLAEIGVLECVGKGRGARYVLSRRFHGFLGRSGEYTRRRGLDRETNKELLRRHLRLVKSAGAPLSELQQVLPAASKKQIQGLLSELRAGGVVESRGKTRAGRWYLVGMAPGEE
jgi:ATP-dependent DNA helicase RecG